MANENDLIQKLMISKKIMDKHNGISRNQSGGNYSIPSSPELQEFGAPQASYNIPQEFLSESRPVQQMPKGSPKDRILSSKLPDEIKKLMIEHPISQPDNMQSPTLSNDLIEKAARLMNTDASGKQIKGSTYIPPQQTTQQFSGLDSNTIKQIVRETVEEVLSENGMLIESVTKSNDVFTFKVGKHVFEGKVTKIKKIKE